MRARTEADDYAAGESRLCVDCEREGEPNPYFFMRESEIQFFQDRNLDTPKRCKRHRELKRVRNASRNAA